jgi:hypothetical protein
VGARRRLHLAWDSGGAVWHARLDAAKGDWKKRVGRGESWLGAGGGRPKEVVANGRLGDLVVTEGGSVWLAAVRATGKGESAVCLAHHTNGWEVRELARGEGFRPPVFHVEPDGTVHLTWADNRGRVFYQRYHEGKASPVETVRPGGWVANGRNPVTAAAGGQVLIVHETLYSDLGYALHEGGKWQTGLVTRPAGGKKSDPRFATDVLHSPQLAVDPHGVVWLFFADATRKHTSFTRWLGSGWSDVYDGRGIHHAAAHFESNYLSPDEICLEKQPPARAAELGLFLAYPLLAGREEFHRIPLAAPALAAGTAVLFLDLLEVARLRGVELTLNEARRHPDNPVFTPGGADSFDSQRVFNHGTVLLDEGVFRMWYSGLPSFTTPGRPTSPAAGRRTAGRRRSPGGGRRPTPTARTARRGRPTRGTPSWTRP